MITLKGFYDDAQYFKSRKDVNIRVMARFADIEPYYYNNASTVGKQLGAAGSAIQKDADDLYKVLNNINTKCRALEVYVRLGDYKKDSLAYADDVFNQLNKLYTEFRMEKESLETQLKTLYRKIQPFSASNPYHNAEKEMVSILEKNRQLLKEWNYNFKEEIKSGWPIESIQKNLSENEQLVSKFKTAPSAIRYPESSSYLSFGRAIEADLEGKRYKINNYNSEARKSGVHANNAYLDFINYYNNDLVETYNDFINYSSSNNKLLGFVKFSPQFEINEKEQAVSYSSQQFKDIPLKEVKVTRRQQNIGPVVSSALNNYVDFINETLRQVKYFQLMLRNYNSSANYYKTSTSTRKATINYNHENFKIPQTSYHKTLNDSKILPLEYVGPLNDQHEVLMNIMKEIDALGVELDGYTQDKKYNTDNFERSDEIIKRCKYLISLIDGRKEHLYKNVNDIFYSYNPENQQKSWYTSSMALASVVAQSKKNLYEAKDLLTDKRKSLSSSDPLRQLSRALIAEEYSNMEGIKRIGRSNGLCPYTPYEDIAEKGSLFSEKISKTQAGSSKDNEKSYEDLLYTYNSIIDDYNKFADLAPIENIKNIHQINVFEFPSVEPSPQIVKKDPEQKDPGKADNTISASIKKPAGTVAPSPDTVTIIKEVKTEVVKRDTVFIEKSRTDTIYINNVAENEDLMSLEGYANNNIVLLLDVSSSMNEPHKLPLLKRSVKQLIQIYRPEDEISVVLYSGKARIALEPTSGKEKAEDPGGD